MRTVTAILRDMDTIQRSKHLNATTRERILAQYYAELGAVAAALPEVKDKEEASPPAPPAKPTK